MRELIGRALRPLSAMSGGFQGLSYNQAACSTVRRQGAAYNILFMNNHSQNLVLATAAASFGFSGSLPPRTRTQSTSCFEGLRRGRGSPQATIQVQLEGPVLGTHTVPGYRYQVPVQANERALLSRKDKDASESLFNPSYQGWSYTKRGTGSDNTIITR